MKDQEPDIRVVNGYVPVRDLIQAVCDINIESMKQVFRRAAVTAKRRKLWADRSATYAVKLKDAPVFLERFRRGMIEADNDPRRGKLWPGDERHFSTMEYLHNLYSKQLACEPGDDQWPPVRDPIHKVELVEVGTSPLDVLIKRGNEYSLARLLSVVRYTGPTLHFNEMASSIQRGESYVRDIDVSNIIDKALEGGAHPDMCKRVKQKVAVQSNAEPMRGGWKNHLDKGLEGTSAPAEGVKLTLTEVPGLTRLGSTEPTLDSLLGDRVAESVEKVVEEHMPRLESRMEEITANMGILMGKTEAVAQDSNQSSRQIMSYLREVNSNVNAVATLLQRVMEESQPMGSEMIKLLRDLVRTRDAQTPVGDDDVSKFLAEARKVLRGDV